MRLVISSVALALAGLAGCGHHERRFTEDATIACLRNRAEALLRPTRATAHGVDVSGVGRDADGTVQVVLYPSEDIAYLQFAGSGSAASRASYRRRNVVVSWDQPGSSKAERRAVDGCLRTEPPPRPAPYRAARQPARFSGNPQPVNLVPTDATVQRSWRFGQRIAIWWQRQSFIASGLDSGGIVIWQPRWRLAYLLRLAPNQIFRVQAQRGDVNGDGEPDLLLFEDMGGSAGCGTHRLLAAVGGRIRQLYAGYDCEDSARVRIRRGALAVYTGLTADPHGIHCCWKDWLRTTIRWRGAERIGSERARVARVPT